MSEPNDGDKVWFITGPQPQEAPGVTLHRREGGAVDAVLRRFEDVEEDWRSMVVRVMNLASSTEELAPAAGMRLTSLSVELGFTASGKLAFIAEAGVSGSITLTFSRAEAAR